MDMNAMWMLIGAIMAILLFGLLYTYNLGRNRQKQRDENVSRARVKHNVMYNPILWVYVLFPIVLAIGVYFMYTWGR